jgi:ABC-type phosphate/phosphonate transport system substrate-binding protein
MYAVDDAAMEMFWTVLRSALRKAGLPHVPDVLSRPTDLGEHWRDPALLLSQTCGFPFVTDLHRQVRYICTPRFRAPGCEGAHYRSAIVVRGSEPLTAIADLRGRRAAYNSRDSQSGYNAFRLLVAPHADDGRFFSAVVATGSHRGSLAAVRSGEADVAAIDAVTLALLRARYPEEIDGLRVLGYTEPAAGLPLITSRLTDDDDVRRLRQACADACDPAQPTSPALLLDGVAVLGEDAYRPIALMRARAEALGYPELA